MANTIVSSVGNQPNETGMGFQSHTIYATNSARWWFFYWASSTTIGSYYSSDASTWTAGATYTMGSGTGSQDGRDFSVFYSNLSSIDVVHMVVSQTDGTPRHVRGTISGTTLSWGSDATAGASPGYHAPMGYTTVLDSAGNAWQVTSNFSDIFIAKSTNADSGGSWTNGFGTAVDVDGSIVNEEHERVILPYAAGGKLLVLYGDGASTTSDNLIHYNYYNGSTWGGETNTGFASTATDFNDWGAVRLSDTDFHVVRRTGSNTFEHRRWNGSSAWSAGDTITTQTSKSGGGVALASNGTNVWLFILDSSAGNNVLWSKWTSGTGWSSWSTLESSSATRAGLGVTQQLGSSNWLTYWTEGSSNPYAIKGALLALGVQISAAATVALFGTSSASASATICLNPVPSAKTTKWLAYPNSGDLFARRHALTKKSDNNLTDEIGNRFFLPATNLTISAAARLALKTTQSVSAAATLALKATLSTSAAATITLATSNSASVSATATIALKATLGTSAAETLALKSANNTISGAESLALKAANLSQSAADTLALKAANLAQSAATTLALKAVDQTQSAADTIALKSVNNTISAASSLALKTTLAQSAASVVVLVATIPQSAAATIALNALDQTKSAADTIALKQADLAASAGGSIALVAAGLTVAGGASVALLATNQTKSAAATLSLIAVNVSQSGAATIALKVADLSASAGSSLALKAVLAVSGAATITLFAPNQTQSAAATIALHLPSISKNASATVALKTVIGTSAGASVSLHSDEPSRNGILRSQFLALGDNIGQTIIDLQTLYNTNLASIAPTRAVILGGQVATSNSLLSRIAGLPDISTVDLLARPALQVTHNVVGTFNLSLPQIYQTYAPYFKALDISSGGVAAYLAFFSIKANAQFADAFNYVADNWQLCGLPSGMAPISPANIQAPLTTSSQIIASMSVTATSTPGPVPSFSIDPSRYSGATMVLQTPAGPSTTGAHFEFFFQFLDSNLNINTVGLTLNSTIAGNTATAITGASSVYQVVNWGVNNVDSINLSTPDQFNLVLQLTRTPHY